MNPLDASILSNPFTYDWYTRINAWILRFRTTVTPTNDPIDFTLAN